MATIAPIVAPALHRGRGWNFQNHRDHGYVGGDDYEVPSGTHIPAIAEGIATATATTVTIERSDGTSVTLRHVFPTKTGRVKVGDIIARSGADGGKWPHWEGRTKAGTRVPVAELVAAYKKATAKRNKKINVKATAAYLNQRGLGMKTAASRNGIRGPIYWRLIQLAGKRDGLYGKGYIVNGIPGPRTRQLEAHYNQSAQ